MTIPTPTVLLSEAEVAERVEAVVQLEEAAGPVPGLDQPVGVEDQPVARADGERGCADVGAQAQRRGGVGKAEHVGGDSHHYRTHGGVFRRHFGEKPNHDGPQHARKFAAKMSEFKLPYFYNEITEGGHGSGADLKQQAGTSALTYTYLQRKLMP